MYNPANPDADNYSILRYLDDCARGADGKFQFQLKWPLRSGQNTQIWKQESNPMEIRTGNSVVGYENVDAPFSSNSWGGIAYNDQNDYSLLDGTINHGNWYYAIGSS